MQNSGKAISKCLPSLKIDHIILLEQCVQLEAYIIIRYFLSFLIFKKGEGNVIYRKAYSIQLSKYLSTYYVPVQSWALGIQS